MSVWRSAGRRHGRWPISAWIRPAMLAALGSVLLASWLVVTPVLVAQDEAAIDSESTAESSFGQALRFSLVASAPSPIQKVVLFMQAPELPNTLTAEIDVLASETIEVTHVVDLTQLRLAPFTTVTYWWLIEDSDGSRQESDRQTLDYVDDQFTWHRLEQDGVQVFWSGNDPAVGQAALDAVADALPEMTAIIPVDPPSPLQVYVYPTAADLRSGLRLTGRDWVGAHAHPELGVILVAAGGSLTASAELAESIPHELTHLYLYEATGVGYESMPLWFDEGLASLFEPVPNPNYATRLQEAMDSGETIAIADLCYTFPAADDRALLAYAQSAALISYIQSEYGNQALQQMITELADGADCQTVTERALGLSLASLNQDWLEQESPQSLLTRLWRNGRAWLAIIAAGFILLGLLVGLPRGKSG